jgi:hypothetical protein
MGRMATLWLGQPIIFSVLFTPQLAELLTGASKAVVVPHGFGHLHIVPAAPLEGSLNYRSIRAHRFLGDIMRLHPLG